LSNTKDDEVRKLGGPEAVELSHNNNGADPGNAMSGTGFDKDLEDKYTESQKKIKELNDEKQKLMEELVAPEGYTKASVEKNGLVNFKDAYGREMPKDAYKVFSIQADKIMSERKLKKEEPENTKNYENAIKKFSDMPMPPGPGKPYNSRMSGGSIEGLVPAPVQEPKIKPVEKDPESDIRLQKGTEKLNDVENGTSSIKPIVIDNSKTIGSIGGNKGTPFVLDSTVDVRTDDPTLLKIQRQNTRYA
jgi:hypothetical protein